MWPRTASQGINVAPFAKAMNLGLGSNDDVDALVMWDRNILGGPGHGGNPNGAEPGIDYALFSLGPGSFSLGQAAFPGGPLLSPADVFFTDFSGSFALYALGSDLGLARIIHENHCDQRKSFESHDLRLSCLKQHVF